MELDPAESHHLLRVMRAQPGQRVRVFGQGREFEGILERAAGQRAQIRLGSELTSPPLPAFRMRFLLPWLKGGRTESVLQKLTELGAAEFIVYRARRDVAHLEASKLERLQRNVVEACKQCERADCPPVSLGGNLADTVAASGLPPERCLVLAERSPSVVHLSTALVELTQAGLTGSPGACGELLIASGPEGGFHPDELAQAAPVATLVSLGPRILRAETAPVAAAAVALSAGGDL